MSNGSMYLKCVCMIAANLEKWDKSFRKMSKNQVDITYDLKKNNKKKQFFFGVLVLVEPGNVLCSTSNF